MNGSARHWVQRWSHHAVRAVLIGLIVFLIFYVAPTHGTSNLLVYIAIRLTLGHK